LFLVIIYGCSKNKEHPIITNEKSINRYIEKAKNKSLKDSIRIINAEKAYQALKKETNNIEKRKKLTSISLVYLNLNDNNRFKKTSHDIINLSKKIFDSSGTALTYNNYGVFYKTQNILDSAYFYHNKAEKLYSNIIIKDNFQHGAAFLGMAIIQNRAKDYTGSSSSLVNAIKKFELSESSDPRNYLSICYSYLGMASNNLGKYDKAIEYHNESIKYAKNLKNKELKETLAFNNIGIVYKNQKNYLKAIQCYNKALRYKTYLKNNQKRYALLLDNLAYMKFLKGERDGVYELFSKALKIRDSLDDKSGISINNLHLAEYFRAIKKDSASIFYANQSRKVSELINHNSNLLESYRILADVHNSDEGIDYAKKYIRLNDSLVKE